MTHIENIPHIFQYGIVHANSANANPDFVTIGDTSLISHRQTKQIRTQNGELIVLGDFIPFYFGVRMPMLYVIQKGYNCVTKMSPDDIVYVAVSLQSIIDSDSTFYFSDGHATDAFSKFYDKTQVDLLPEIIDWGSVKTEHWSGDNISTAVKRKKQAEFLIRGDIPADKIHGIVCYNETAFQKLAVFGVDKVCTNIKIFPKAYY